MAHIYLPGLFKSRSKGVSSSVLALCVRYTSSELHQSDFNEICRHLENKIRWTSMEHKSIVICIHTSPSDSLVSLERAVLSGVYSHVCIFGDTCDDGIQKFLWCTSKAVGVSNRMSLATGAYYIAAEHIHSEWADERSYL